MIKPLTSLRYIFALMVFLHHLGFLSGNWFYDKILYEGYIGVSFFYVLSGAILSYTFKENVKMFYIKRISRIFPTHWLTLLISLPFFLPYELNKVGMAKLFSNTFLLQSFIPKSGFYYSFNSLAWSISDEMFFYLLFPLAFALSKWQKIIFLMVGGIAILILPNYVPAAYNEFVFKIFPITRFFDFLLGMVVYDWLKSSNSLSLSEKSATGLQWLAVAVFILFFALHNAVSTAFRNNIYYWIPMGCIIFAFARNNGFLGKLLGAPWLVLLGNMSFAFYMIQFLVLYGLGLLNLNNTFYVIASFSLCMLLAYVIYKYYEIPMRDKFRNGLSKLFA